jgi:hypothetical protein
MTTRLAGRRMFLMAGVGSAVAIPFLPSILGSVRAQVPSSRCFVSVRADHGGVWPDRFFPSESTLRDSTSILGSEGWTIREAPLVRSLAGTRASLSPVLTAEASALDDRIASKTSLLMGLDYTLTPGHNTSMQLGGYAQRLDGAPERDTAEFFKPTIDQIIARSAGFYTEPPVSHVGVLSSWSYWHTQPANHESPIAQVRSTSSVGELWTELFQPGGAPLRELDRGFAVDRALEAYRRLRSGAFGPARRLSRSDRDRLDEHMDRLSRLEGNIARAAMCDATSPGPNISWSYPGANDPVVQLGLAIETVLASIQCGLCRVFNLRNAGAAFTTGASDDWHQEVPHRSTGHASEDGTYDATRTAEDHMVTFYQGNFEHFVLPLLRALDVDDGMGRNYLDESLVMWASEAGMSTHNYLTVPVMLAGSLGGKLSTGHFVDYRRPVDDEAPGGADERRRTSLIAPAWRRGLTFDQLLGTILHGFEIPVSDYDRYRERDDADPTKLYVGGPTGGYGGYLPHERNWKHDVAVRRFAEQPLPIVWRG